MNDGIDFMMAQVQWWSEFGSGDFQGFSFKSIHGQTDGEADQPIDGRRDDLIEMTPLKMVNLTYTAVKAGCKIFRGSRENK